MSSANNTSNIDWALIHINQNLLSPVLGGPDSLLVTFVLNSVPKRSAVLVRTRSHGLMKGFITINPTFMQLPHDIALQEV
jgi:hypothetical protein